MAWICITKCKESEGKPCTFQCSNTSSIYGETICPVGYDIELKEQEESSPKIKVVVKEPGKIAQIQMVDNSLETLQGLVGGYIETMPFVRDTILICNEEGKINGLKPNSLSVNFDRIHGAAVIVNRDPEFEDFESLTGSQIDALCRLFGILENEMFPEVTHEP